jgi:hypothetical protein
MEFPLVERELARSGRHWRTYALRVAATGAPCVALVFATPFSVLDTTDSAEVGEAVSSILLALSIFFQYLVTFFLAPMYCAGTIAQEKQERTLGLLLMADFRGWDVYAAKFMSAFIQCALLIASTLPLLAISAILGGISVPAAAARFVLLLVATCTVCALGVLASTLARKPSEALYITVFFIAAWMGVGWCIANVPDPTGTESRWIVAAAGWGDDLFLESPLNWIPGVIFSLIISVAAMAFSLVLLPRQAYQKSGPAKRIVPRRVDRFVVRSVFRLRPATALIHALLSDQRSGAGSGLLRALLPATMLLLGLVPIVGLLFVFAVLCYDLSTSIAHLRRNQAYDDLLVADLSVEAIARSTWRALLVHSWPYYFGFLSGFGVILLPGSLMNDATFTPMSLTFSGGAGIVIACGAYAFAVAASCAVAVLRWGAIGQTLAGLFIFGWIQMFFFIGLAILAQGFSEIDGSDSLVSAAALIIMFGVGMSTAIYAGLTMLFRRGFEHDFAYTLRNPDRMTLAPNN